MEMLADNMEIVRRGDQNGNRWIIKVTLPSGRRIFGLATENIYGGDWDLGPTRNYVVEGDKPFLIDTSRYGMGGWGNYLCLSEVRATFEELDGWIVSPPPTRYLFSFTCITCPSWCWEGTGRSEGKSL